MRWKGGDINMIKKKKGIVINIQGEKAIAMTKNGEFIKVNLPQEVDIGSEIEFYRKPHSTDEDEVSIWVSENLHKHERLNNILSYIASKEDHKMAQEQKNIPDKIHIN